MMFRWFDSNQRMNDQGFIDSEPPQIFYTSIIISAQVKTTHFETRLRTECKTEFMLLQKTFFRKIVFKKWGAGLRPAASASACTPISLKKFFYECFNWKRERCRQNIFLVFCPEIRRIEVQLGILGVSPTDLFYSITSLNRSEQAWWAIYFAFRLSVYFKNATVLN